MARDLNRLLSPKSIAVVGGGNWCRSVVDQAKKFGFTGSIHPVHPMAKMVAECPTVPSIRELPIAPDACFVGINRNATIDAVRELSAIGAGGAVCFASGFSEARAEDNTASALQDALLNAAGEMPILGPNCYGFVNALDGALLWPDQHGCKKVDRGVAILTQSSNIAINLSMQKRGLPISHLITCGNMAQTTQAEIANALLDDERVTAIGLHIEGFANVRDWEALATKAHSKKIPLVAVKVGKSQQAQSSTISHTASLAGSDAGAQALLDRLGISRAATLPELLETLKLLHVLGPLASNRIASISCSGGEASLAADTAVDYNVSFPPLNAHQTKELRSALGSKVALANPLDYHTYIWRDTKAMTKAWGAMVDPKNALTLSIVDYPRADTCDPSDWDSATQAAIGAARDTGGNFGVVATLPELMPEDVAESLIADGVVPLYGLSEAMAAIENSVEMPWEQPDALCIGNPPLSSEMLNEHTAKSILNAYGVHTPKSVTFDKSADVANVCIDLRFPLVAKATGLAHKSEHNAVVLNISSFSELEEACAKLPSRTILVEEMITDAITEILIGVTHDPAHGFVMTFAAGGTLTEIFADSVSVLVPTSESEIKTSLNRLKIHKILNGFRNQPAVNIDAIVATALALQTYIIDNCNSVSEIEINPLICTRGNAVAADALIRKRAE